MAGEPVSSRRFWSAVGLSFAALCAAVLALPLVGSAHIDFARALAGQTPDKELFFDARLPRVLLSMIVGGALAVAGVLFQALLRDALATPYTLGVSSGASLGAVISICAGWPHLWLLSFAGAAATLMLVLGISAEGRRLSSFTLLLSGVTLNSIAMAMILFLQNFATVGQSFQIVRWLMGSIDPVAYTTLAWLCLAVLPVVAIVFLQAREWNLLALGEEWAAQRGVAASRLILTGYLLGSVLTGAVTALTGPIGFIGLVVPHALRLWLGADHRLLIPCSFSVGAVFLGVCDTLARTILAPTEIPVGVVTALFGGPFFIWMLRNRGWRSAA